MIQSLKSKYTELEMLGVTAAFASAIFATSKDLLSKSLASKVTSTSSAFASFLFALPYYLVTLLILWLLGIESFVISGAFWGYIFLRALSDTGAEWFKMSALAHGEISVVSIILALHPLLLAIISPIITGDHLPPAGFVAVILIVLASVVLLYREAKEGEGIDNKAILYAVLAAIFFALNNCFDRLAVRTSSASLAGFMMTVLSCIFIFPAFHLSKIGYTELRGNLPLLFGRGLFEIFFMVLKLVALQFLQAPYVAVLLRLSLLFSIIGGKVFFKEHHFVRRIIAGTLTTAGIGIVLLLL